MATPKVSIILPIYKVEPYIADCLRSILAQTRQDFEIIAIDDCSPDRSGEIARGLLEAQTAIPWTFERNATNRGIAETRKIAANLARGEFVLCVDSDDFIAPGLVETAYAEAVRNDADVVNFGGQCIDGKGGKLYDIASGDDVVSGVHALTRIFDLSLQAYVWNKLIRRSIFTSIEHPVGLIYEDIAISVQAFARAKTVRLIPDQLYFYVKRDEGLSVRFNPRIVDLFEIVDRVERSTSTLGIENYRRLLFRLKYVYAYRTIAFQTARLAPDYSTAAPILGDVSRKLRFGHIGGMYMDRRPKLSLVMCLLKIHPRCFYQFVRRFN